ncbi:MAG: response regulator [Myxococcales bacterium]|nr:response regulator [Myxococcales bacterium]
MNTEGEERSKHVLLVEDDELYARSVRRIFDRVGAEGALFIAEDGAEALALLRGEGTRPPMPLPRLILLDLRLPKMDGIELLEILRSEANRALRELPVVILTGSQLDSDRKATAALGVSGYFIKGEEVDELARILADEASA